MRRFALAFVLALIAQPAFAAHYASLRSDKVYLREGPSYQHRILYIYKRKDYPLEVLADFEGWRRVRDVDGTTGWISQTMLSDLRTVLVTGKTKTPLLASPDPTAAIEAEAKPGVVGKLKACKPRFCKITAGGVTGWIDRSRIWGVDWGEIID